MSSYIYPSTIYDDKRRLLAQTGQFWSKIYDGRDLVRNLLSAVGQDELQTLQLYQHVIDALDLQTIPIYRIDNWYQIRIKQSELGDQPIRYGEDAIYGNQTDGRLLRYGEEWGPQSFVYTVPEALRAVPVITNRITNASLAWFEGVDYEHGDGFIRFRSDPFQDSRIPKYPLYDGSEVVDYAITLWLFRSRWDRRDIYLQYGATVAGEKRSSQYYLDYVRALWTALVDSTGEKHIEELVAAVTATPICKSDGEVIEVLQRDNNHLVIVTDKNVYLYPTTATEIVAVGDTLYAGNQLVDAVKFYDLSSTEALEDLSSLHLDKNYLAAGYAGGLTFENKDVPLVVEDVDGRTKVSFEIGGFPSDIVAFWDEVHARGIATGERTLAQLLDVRGSEATTEPTAASLPATVNPCEFLISNFLRFNTQLVRIKVDNRNTPDDLTPADLTILRKIVPPWLSILLLYDLEVPEEVVSMDGAGSSTTTGYTEEVESVSAGEPVETTVEPATFVTEQVKLFYLDEICG